MTSQWAQLPKKQSVESVFLTMWHCISSAELTNTRSFRLIFWRFFPQGQNGFLGIKIFLGFFKYFKSATLNHNKYLLVAHVVPVYPSAHAHLNPA